jgi:hypothetical protein
MRSFSREERGQAKQSQLLQAKLKPQATLWTPSNSLVSPAWMKNIKRGAGLGCRQLARSLPLLTHTHTEGGGGLVKHEVEHEDEMKGESPEEDDAKAKRKYAEYQQQQQQQAQYEADEGQASSGHSSFPPGSPAFSSPGNDPAGSSPPSSPPTTAMPPHKKAMVRETFTLIPMPSTCPH